MIGAQRPQRIGREYGIASAWRRSGGATVSRLVRRVGMGRMSWAWPLAALSLALPGAASAQVARSDAAGLRDVLLVGNNWDGTADVLDVPTYTRIDRINVAPDRTERIAEIALSPTKLPFYLFVREVVGEGHDQMVDDLYASADGRTLYASRPSFADVVAIDMATRKIVWRFPVTGVRADHMAISPDGKRLVVSTHQAAGASFAEVLDSATGKKLGQFPSGDTPHENNFSRDGKLIFHASIGRVYTPTDTPELDATKGNRFFEIVDADTLKVVRQLNMAEKLAEFGRPGMSSAVRPMALSPDERTLYFQVSFFHGFVEYDLDTDKVTRVADLPIPPRVAALRRDQYILDSAHHGIAMSGDGKKLCIAGTMSDYVAIVSRETFAARIHELGARTYWSTTSADGKYCYVSVAGDDTMSIISYDSEQEIARVPVGFHPQRARTGQVATAIFGAPASTRMRPGRLTLRAQPRSGRRRRLSGELAIPAGVAVAIGCRGRVALELRRGRRTVARGSARLRMAGTRCRYARTLRVPARHRRGRLTVRARFGGNATLLPLRAALRIR